MNKNPTSQKSYMIKSIREWIIDNNGKPVLFINLINLISNSGCIPVKFLKEEYLVLNVSNTAIQKLSITLDSVKFVCTFDNVEFNCVIPITSIYGIVDIDTKEGLVFAIESKKDLNASSKKIANDIISNIQSKFL